TPQPAGPLRSPHLNLRRSLYGRSARPSVVVLHPGAKKEISPHPNWRFARLPQPADANELSARLSLDLRSLPSRQGLTLSNGRLPPSNFGLAPWKHRAKRSLNQTHPDEFPSESDGSPSCGSSSNNRLHASRKDKRSTTRDVIFTTWPRS